MAQARRNSPAAQAPTPMQDAHADLDRQKYHLAARIADAEKAARSIAFDAAGGDIQAQAEWSRKNAEVQALKVELATLVQAHSWAAEQADLERVGGIEADRLRRIAEGKAKSLEMLAIASNFDAKLAEAFGLYNAFKAKADEIERLGFNVSQVSSCRGYRPLVTLAIDFAGLGAGPAGAGAAPLASSAQNYLGLPVSDDRIPMDW